MSVYSREELVTSLVAAIDEASVTSVGPLILSPRELAAIVDWAVGHGVQIRKPRIKRGVILESLEDAAKYEIPIGTALRASNDRLWGWYHDKGFGKAAYELFGPFRCIDVPGDDDD